LSLTLREISLENTRTFLKSIYAFEVSCQSCLVKRYPYSASKKMMDVQSSKGESSI